MSKLLWNLLMWRWTRLATRFYTGPSADGVWFNTACFQGAVKETVGAMPVSQDANVWLVSNGWHQGTGGCHWFRTAKAANEHFEKMTKAERG